MILAQCPVSILSVSTQGRNLHSDTQGVEAFKQKDRKIYTNKNGEEIAFSPCRPPPGYVFVPAGNVFITRNCRKLAQNLIVVCRPKSGKEFATQIGLHVPEEVFIQVKSEFEVKRAKINEELCRHLDKEYPQIPSAHKNEIHRLASSHEPNLTGKSALRDSENVIRAYIRDRYTRLMSLLFDDKSPNTEAIARTDQKIQDIMASWRGEAAPHDATVPGPLCESTDRHIPANPPRT